MRTNKAARNSGNYSRANVHGFGDSKIIAYDVFLGVFGALVMLGVPFVMAVLKQFGWW